MYNFILQIALMLGLGTMIYLIARAAPRMGDDMPVKSVDVKKIFGGLTLEKIDASFHGFLEKFLRKVKLVIMRFDNYVGRHLENLKKFGAGASKNGGDKPNLFESAENGGTVDKNGKITDKN